MSRRPLPLLTLIFALAIAACGHESAQSAPAAADESAAPEKAVTAPAPATQGAASSTSAASAAEAASSVSDAETDEQPASAPLERLVAAPQELPDGRYKPGVNYDTILPAQPTDSPPGQIEVMEVFWLGCPHCYALEPFLRDWMKKKPGYVSFVRIPVMWGPVHQMHAHLYYTLEALGRDDLVERAFDTIHGGDVLVGQSAEDSAQAQLDWAKQNGVDPAAFKKAYDSFGVTADLQHAQEITDRYHVEGVPFIIVDGKYSTDVGKAGGHEQLIELINELTGYEHKKVHAG